jgi:hypothetical protein
MLRNTTTSLEKDEKHERGKFKKNTKRAEVFFYEYRSLIILPEEKQEETSKSGTDMTSVDKKLIIKLASYRFFLI